jgi:hypothetical protein
MRPRAVPYVTAAAVNAFERETPPWIFKFGLSYVMALRLLCTYMFNVLEIVGLLIDLAGLAVTFIEPGTVVIPNVLVRLSNPTFERTVHTTPLPLMAKLTA